MLIEAEHPIHFVSQFLRSVPELRAVEMSIYSYEPQSVADARELVLVSPSNLHDTFCRLRDVLQPNQEVAFHSRLHVGIAGHEHVLHLPMIDFKGGLSES